MKRALKGARTGFKFIKDGDVVRFQGNRIIRDMLKATGYHGLTEAHLGVRSGKYTAAELRQWYRLTMSSASSYLDVFPMNKKARLAVEDVAELDFEITTEQEKVQ